MMVEKKSSIKIDGKVKDQLKEVALVPNETYQHIIERLLEFYKENK